MKKKLMELVKFFVVAALMTVTVICMGKSVMKLAVALGWESGIDQKSPEDIIPDGHPNRLDSDGTVNLDSQPDSNMPVDYYGDPWDLESHDYSADTDGHWDAAPGAYSVPEDCKGNGPVQEEAPAIDESRGYFYPYATTPVMSASRDPAIAEDPVSDGFIDFGV